MWRVEPTVLLVLALSSLALVGGCQTRSETHPAEETHGATEPTTSAGAAAAETSSAAQRPSRHYWVINADDHCFVYWTDGELRSVDARTRCPRELQPGEKLRLAGKICLRESSVPDRNVPVRCPKQIFYAERDDRAGEGEWKLPAAKRE